MISVAWGTTNVIFVPQSYLTHVSGTFYTMDTNLFREDLKDLEDGLLEGMIYPDTHKHNTQYSVAGTTYARSIEIIAPYSVEFEDGQYSVRLEGSNNNIFDVQNGILVQNQVQVIPTNSGGLIVTSGGSLLTPQAIRDAMTLAKSAGANIEDGSLDRYVKEAWQLQGLEVANPLEVTDSSRKVGTDIDQTLSDDGTTTTVERQ